MDELHQQLVENTEKLRTLLSTASTEAVAEMCGAYSLRPYLSNEEDSGLEWPLKQQIFLLGLLLTSQEPECPKQFDRGDWDQSVILLNEIFNSYARILWPKPEEVSNLRERWREIRGFVLPTFIHYVDTGLLASIEQVSKKITLYLSPFDDYLRTGIGISASDALRITDWIVEAYQKAVNELQEAASADQEARFALLERADRERWSTHRLHREAQKDHYINLLNKLMMCFQKCLRVSRNSLRKQFGAALADSYWNTFVSQRGEVSNFVYLTEWNAAEEKPMFQIDQGVAILPLVNALYNAILVRGERVLLGGEQKEDFYKRWDKILEREVEQLMQSLFDESARYISGIYETVELQYEHDLIILWNRKVFVIEAKATTLIEPFDDPSQAFAGIKSAFQSDRGIQKGYDQANRIRRKLVSGNQVTLYNDQGQIVTTLHPDEIDEIYCVCVTWDDFDVLAVDLSLLLEKDEEDSYPWVVNIFDLECLIGAWDYFLWGADKVCEYLNTRIRLHGKVLPTDELDIAGFFVRHGGLHWLMGAKEDRIYITPAYSQVFDQVEGARNGGEPLVYSPTSPFIEDMGQMIADAMQGDAQSSNQKPTKVRSQGRNEPCACGSGKKYKKCCGKNN